MFEVIIKTVEMPIADKVRKVAEIRHQQIAEERHEKYLEALRLAEEDFPNFLAFVNAKIDKASYNGKNSITISFDDAYSFGNAKQDSRCSYRFEGCFSKELAEKLEYIYEQLGFSCYCKRFYSSTYRIGYLDIHW